MKRTLPLALSALLLQSALSSAQDVFQVPAPGSQPDVEYHSTGPLGGFFQGCDNCPARVWGGAEYLMWWTKKIPVNTPLMTEALSTTDPKAGQIGSANTAVLLGNQSYDSGMRSGYRLTLGAWLHSQALVGVEANYFYLSPDSGLRSAGSPGTPVIGIPYLNAQTGKEDFITVAVPGVAGSATLRLSNILQGGELNFVGRLISTNCWTITGLAGFRYVNFNEELDFDVHSTIPAAGFNFTSHDSFQATNNFYGGQVGLRGEYRLGSFFVEATGKVALGVMEQSMDINGSSTDVNPAGGPFFNFTNAPGATYALPSNIGNHSHSAFCVVPETDIKLGYNITRNIQAFVGYNFLYLSDVERPGLATEHSINPSQSPGFVGFPNKLVGPAAPSFSFSRTDFWAQGVNFGLSFKF